MEFKKLTKQEMSHLCGGDYEEFCRILAEMFNEQIITQDWSEEEWIAATDAWNTFCV